MNKSGSILVVKLQPLVQILHIDLKILGRKGNLSLDGKFIG